jgi:hypothetical protein
MHPKAKLEEGNIVTVIDLPARNGICARVIRRFNKKVIIQALKTGETLIVERSQIRKNTQHSFNRISGAIGASGFASL